MVRKRPFRAVSPSAGLLVALAAAFALPAAAEAPLGDGGRPATASAVSDASRPSACPFRDPEDGACYRTADDADLAWLSRGATAPAAVRVPVPALPAAAAAAPPAMASHLETASLPLEADPDGDDEDGGPLAIQDPVGARTAARTGDLPQLSPAQKSLWRRLAGKVKDLVVRKADSKPASLPEDDLAALFATGFPLPIDSFPPEKLRDSFNASRGRHRRHHAIDLGAPRGTPIVAVCDGTIERLGRDRRGGIVIYLRDQTGRFIFYYAHLQRYVKGLRVGDEVKRGQQLGEVGSTGRASGPHLHFAIFRDQEAPSPWKGLVVNPYVIFSTLAGK